MSRALLVNDVSEVLVTEVSKSRVYRVGCCLAQSAEGVSLDCLAQFFELIKILHCALTLSDSCEDLEHSLCTDTARCALTAGLVADKFHIELSNVNHAVVFVHYDSTAGTHHGSLSYEVIEIDRLIEVLSCEASAGRTTCLDSLELLTIRDSAADVIDELSECCTHRNFYETNVINFSAQSEYLSTLGLLCTNRSEVSSAFSEDVRNACECLYVVNACRLAPETLDSRERRSRTRHTTLTFDGVEESCFLTANECACTKSDLAVEAEV